MKNLVKEVLFPAYGDWKVEAYAWSKELARRLNTSFRVLENGKSGEDFNQQLLQGDGYYFGHYHHAPQKTHLTSLKKGFTPEFTEYLKDSSGLAVIVLEPSSKSIFQDDAINLSHHVVLSIPNPIEKTSKESEFMDILKQISILNLPFDFPQGKQSWLAKLTQTFQVFL